MNETYTPREWAERFAAKLAKPYAEGKITYARARDKYYLTSILRCDEDPAPVDEMHFKACLTGRKP